jgi:DNA-binding transcriptional LysR family regulator
MMIMARRHFDLHLLEIALALHEERSVSKVAVRLRMSQPAISTALARLRRAFNDPLFVRTPRGMEPTPRAQALVGPAREIMLRADRELFADLRFDPATTDATLTFALSDVGEWCSAEGDRAPAAGRTKRQRAARCRPRRASLRYGLETGEIDLAIGYFPDLVKGNFYQQRLFTHHFTCLLRAIIRSAAGS